jgi:hypothetical protein
MPRQSLDPKLRDAVVQKDNGKCRGIDNYECPLKDRTEDASGFHVDHILPVADGGTDDIDNLQLLCPCCHAVKTKRDADNRNTLAALKRQKEELKKELRELGMKDKIEREQEEIKRLQEHLNEIKRSKDPKQTARYLTADEREQRPVPRFMTECIERIEEYDPNTSPVTVAAIRWHFNEWRRHNEIRDGSFTHLEGLIRETYGRPPRGGWTQFKLKDLFTPN